MKLDLLDIVASVLGPVMAVVLLVGVVRVRFLTFNLQKSDKNLIKSTEKSQLLAHISLCGDVFADYLLVGHNFGFLCACMG